MRRNDVIVTKGIFEGPFVKPYIASLMFVAQYIPSDKSTTLFAFFLLRAVEHKNTEVAGNISPRLEPFFSRFFYKWHFTTAGSIQCIIVLRMTHCNRSGTTICWRNTIDCCLQNSTFSPTSDSCIFPLLCSKLWFLNLWKTMKLSGAPTQDCNALLNVISQWWHFPANIPKKKKRKWWPTCRKFGLKFENHAWIRNFGERLLNEQNKFLNLHVTTSSWFHIVVVNKCHKGTESFT